MASARNLAQEGPARLIYFQLPKKLSPAFHTTQKLLVSALCRSLRFCLAPDPQTFWK